MKSAIDKALETWNFGNDAFHAKLKLAGESGEILDLYGKHLFKPNFSMWDCAVCKDPQGLHTIFGNSLWCEGGADYTPLILDELGDYWYYLRILFHIYNIPEPKGIVLNDLDESLFDMNFVSAQILRLHYRKQSYMGMIDDAFKSFSSVLHFLEIDLDELTNLNYKKLKDGHGWK